ncbi:MAG: sugar phosphate isomerase/epimerase family protein [Roseimicrobium sp.]
MISRRHFLTTSLSALGASALPAIEPIKRSGPSKMELGVAAYGFRDYFEWSRDKKNKIKDGKAPMSIIDFIDWCADQGVPGAELTSYFFPPDTDTAFCEKVRAHADKRSVRITGSAIGNTYTNPPGEKRDEQLAYTKKWVDFCAILGAPHIRVFAGAAPKGMSLEDGVKNCIETYQMALDYAATKKIYLGIENHGGVVAEPDQLIAIIQAAKSEYAGINFDSGNFHTEDPYADLAKIAPYTLNVQLKVDIKRKGAAKEEPSDIPRVIQILRDAQYSGWFTLEYERKDPFVEMPQFVKQLKPLLG